MRYILLILALCVFSTAHAGGDRKKGWSQKDKEQDVVMGGD